MCHSVTEANCIPHAYSTHCSVCQYVCVFSVYIWTWTFSVESSCHVFLISHLPVGSRFRLRFQSHFCSEAWILLHFRTIWESWYSNKPWRGYIMRNQIFLDLWDKRAPCTLKTLYCNFQNLKTSSPVEEHLNLASKKDSFCAPLPSAKDNCINTWLPALTRQWSLFGD